MQNDPAFISFLAQMQAKREEYFARMQYTAAQAVTLTEAGQKFIRLIHGEKRGEAGEVLHRSGIGFVALADFTNKTLGDVKRGDIFKSATWAAPAKHARGNIFNPDNGASALSDMGRIHYL